MKLFKILFLLLSVMGAAGKCFAQKPTSLFHISIQGSWDKNKQKDRAQFGGDNKLLTAYIGSFKKDMIQLGTEVKAVGCISFVVAPDGSVDSLEILKSIDHTWDTVFHQIVQQTSGKWRSALVEGQKKSEKIRMWYNVYKGTLLKATLAEALEDARKYSEKGDHKKALASANAALAYDALSTEMIVIKTKSLANLNRKREACEFIRPTLDYNNDSLTALVKETCN